MEILKTGKMAREILDSFEMTQSTHLNDRAHLIQACRSPPQWSVEDYSSACFIVRDASRAVCFQVAANCFEPHDVCAVDGDVGSVAKGSVLVRVSLISSRHARL